MRRINAIPLVSFLLSILIIALVAITLVLSQPHIVQSDTSTPILGYMWSDNIGWIDLNCQNTGGSECTAYNNWGLSVDSSGNISGYAWSDNIGWISANSADGSHPAPVITTGQITGWLKALAANNNDWDGWIDIAGSGYGPTENAAGNITGYSWGSENIGWLSWQASTKANTCQVKCGCSGNTITQSDNACNVTSIATCNAPQYCSVGSCVCLTPTASAVTPLTVKPSIVPVGGQTQVSWDVTNMSKCSVEGTNNDSWSWQSSGSSYEWAENETSGVINQSTTYTLTCTGLDSSTFTETATVTVAPAFQEK